MQDVTAIKDYHAHVYYDASTKEKAAQLRRWVEERFAGQMRMGSWHDEEVGQHVQAMYQIAFFGALALGKKTSLDNTCGPDKSQCPPSAQGDIDSLKNSATGSTVGFAVGGGALAAGLIVLLTSKSQTTEGSAPHASIEPYVGPRSLGVTGAF